MNARVLSKDVRNGERGPNLSGHGHKRQAIGVFHGHVILNLA